jgi:hypothetical protein
MQENIEKALAIAMHALPKRLVIPPQDFQKYRVELSADVTAHCRKLGLLTETQYVSYADWIPAPNMGTPATLHPHAYEADETRLGYAPQMPDRKYIPVPRDEELRREFLAIQNPQHNLFQHELRPFPPPTQLLI